MPDSIHKLFRSSYSTGSHITMAIQIFGSRVYGNIYTQINGSLIDRRCKRIIDHSYNTMLFCQIRYRFNIRNG